MSDIGPEQEMHNSAAEAAEGRAERKRWGPKFWKRLGVGGALLIGAALLPTLAPWAATYLAAPLVAAGVPGIATGAAVGAKAAGAMLGVSTALTPAVAEGVAFSAGWLAPLAGFVGGYNVLRSIGPGAKYAQALGK